MPFFIHMKRTAFIQSRLLALTALIWLTLGTCSLWAQNGGTRLARLKYRGGGDWYANATSLKNLTRFANEHIGTNLQLPEATVEAGSADLFRYPFVHMTGHGNVVFAPDEVRNLRAYLTGGGFLHIDDNYGMDPFVRAEVKKIFPETDWVELPFQHPLYRQRFSFPGGLPKIHEHDGKPAQGFGIFYKGRLVIFYSYECDLGNGWEDAEVHNDPEETRKKALQMGANLIQFVFGQ